MLIDQKIYVVQDKASRKFWPGPLDWGRYCWQCFRFDPKERNQSWVETGKGKSIFMWDSPYEVYKSIRKGLRHHVEQLHHKNKGLSYWSHQQNRWVQAKPNQQVDIPSDSQLWQQTQDSLEIIELTLTYADPRTMDFRRECAPKTISRLYR